MGNFTRFRMAGMIPARVAGRSDRHTNKLVNDGVKGPEASPAWNADAWDVK